MPRSVRIPGREEAAIPPPRRSFPLALKQQTRAAAMEPLAYRIDQAAAVIGIGRTKLYALIRDGKLRAHRHDGVTLIHRRDLEAYLAETAVPLPTNAAQ